MQEVKMLWSSAKTIQLQMESQTTNNKISMGQNMLKFIKRKNAMKCISDFLEPLNGSGEMMNLNIKVEDAIRIPEWATTDWIVYEYILFHIYTNAVKFNTFRGAITISFDWIPMIDSESLLDQEFQNVLDDEPG